MCEKKVCEIKMRQNRRNHTTVNTYQHMKDRTKLMKNTHTDIPLIFRCHNVLQYYPQRPGAHILIKFGGVNSIVGTDFPKGVRATFCFLGGRGGGGQRAYCPTLRGRTSQGATMENFEHLEPLDCRKRRIQSLNSTFLVCLFRCTNEGLLL